MFAGCLQIMWAHWQLIRVEGGGYLQLIRAENTDVCRSYGLCLQAVIYSHHTRKKAMRILCILFLVVISIIEIGPVPITPVLLIWVLLFRPAWFYDLVIKIYHKN